MHIRHWFPYISEVGITVYALFVVDWCLDSLNFWASFLNCKSVAMFGGLQIRKPMERNEAISLVQQSRRPNLSSLQIPERTLESSLSAFTMIDIQSIQSPSSTRAGLPPRPHSAKIKSSVKYLFPQKSFRAKNLPHDGEKTILILPDTASSDGPLEKPSTSRSFSLNRMFFSPSIKATHSLPVTPSANSGSESVQGRHLESHSDFSVSAYPTAF